MITVNSKLFAPAIISSSKKNKVVIFFSFSMSEITFFSTLKVMKSLRVMNTQNKKLSLIFPSTLQKHFSIFHHIVLAYYCTT